METGSHWSRLNSKSHHSLHHLVAQGKPFRLVKLLSKEFPPAATCFSFSCSDASIAFHFTPDGDKTLHGMQLRFGNISPEIFCVFCSSWQCPSAGGVENIQIMVCAEAWFGGPSEGAFVAINALSDGVPDRPTSG
jgi:hypothetical protein